MEESPAMVIITIPKRRLLLMVTMGPPEELVVAAADEPVDEAVGFAEDVVDLRRANPID